MKDHKHLSQVSYTLADMCISHNMGQIDDRTFACNLMMFACDANDLPIIDAGDPEQAKKEIQKILDKTCISCESPAKLVRHTQFAGDHPFCVECAIHEINKASPSEAWSVADGC